MAMLTAYIDDSGTDANSPIAVAAGFVTDIPRWERFNREWRALLSADQILDKGFHMKDFMARPRRGVFAGWEDDRCDVLYNALIRTIDDTILMGFSAAVKKADYDAKVKGKLRRKLGGHYRFCAATCVWQIQKWLRSQEVFVAEPISYVFGRGTLGNNKVSDLFRDLLKFNEIRRDFGIHAMPQFESAVSTYPLQSADIIAWKSTKHLRQFDPDTSFMPELRPEKVKWCRFFPKAALVKYVPEVAAKYGAKRWPGPPGGFV